MKDELSIKQCIEGIDEVVKVLYTEKKWEDPEWMAAAIVKLSSYNYTLGSYKAELLDISTRRESELKRKREEIKLQVMRGELEDYKDSTTASYADSVKTILALDELEAWMKANRAFELVKTKYSDTQDVMDAMRTSVSYAKTHSEYAQVSP